MFLSRYNDRPSVLKVDHEVQTNMEIDVDGGKITKSRKGTVHSLNEFDITVWEDGEVTARRKHHAPTDPGKHFPNMSVSDGAINFPIEDLVSFILDRVTPAELAEGIIADDEAREALVEKMAERYNEPGFEDTDRRKFLAKIQQQIHATSLDEAVRRLNNLEQNARSYSDLDRWRAVELGHYKLVHRLYLDAISELIQAGKIDDAEALKRAQYLTTPEQLETRVKEHRDPIAIESVGPHWSESRDFWRKELTKFFPEPNDDGGSDA